MKRKCTESPPCTSNASFAARQVSPNDSAPLESKKSKPTIPPASSESNLGSARVVARVQVYDENTRSWGDWQLHLWPSENREDHCLVFRLNRGGTVRIFPNHISHDRAEAIRQELLTSGLFRQYTIQCNDEPRAHFLLHDEATDCFEDPQPGYGYSSVIMKARPLNLLPKLKSLAQEMAVLCGVPSWNLGVNPVCMRGGQDKIGKLHAWTHITFNE